MVLLSRIYTRTGDKGTTALGDGRRVPKDALRIEAYGTVDELNAVLGLALLGIEDAEGSALLKTIQNDLFDLGADLCVPERPRRGSAARSAKRLRITEAHVRPLEQAIDRMNAVLNPLKSFVLPGGTIPSSWLHLARTVCRRAERRLVTLARKERINRQAIIYLNRLSDLLFVMARRANDGGRRDVLWVPGGAGAARS
ncbi:MAG TPA: cob(I)yrinic acid a,c-diamide adenosyltransferase [Candidatus Polarisedimenticolia bacterium]|nr:cob(I)yrinic acid a,c-diamide adenosyltransferase [Candidatus Polarisedimenticolia bacterium]